MPFSHHGSGGEGDSAEYRGWSRERSVAGWERGRCRKGPTERARREGVGPSKPTPYRRTLGGRGVLLARTGRPMKRLPKREVASAPEAPAPARACAGKRGRDLGPAPSTIDTVRMHGQNAQHQHAHPNPAAGPPNPGWPAHGHELWPAHASGRSERRRAGCASGRRTCAAGGERGARLVGGPRGGALGGRSAGRGSAGNASAPASGDYPARGEAGVRTRRAGAGAHRGGRLTWSS